METYVDVNTNVGDYTVEINTGGWGAAKYTIWTDTGESVAEGIYAHAYDNFQEVADAVVEQYIADFEVAN